MQRSLVLLSVLILISASGCVAQNIPESTPVSPNAGLNPPIYNSWDLINVNTAPTIGPVVGTLGTRYFVVQSICIK